ncbi:cobalamin B12-binding domain-containing protein [Pseudovibrio sp. Ad37]|uniref:cobalamin B12-binding domain-containing protein n=1 Tax=Pseudovibrio sp. Ad37 TaxID=989422 RepID=UPI0007AE629B|nr:cobalamin-dependent protein [Pseudovibrio sp. Ad37]
MGNTSTSLGDANRFPKIILCVAASDAHVVGNHMIAMFLRDNGLQVINLGAATPIEEIMDAYQRNPDVLAIVIGSMNGHAVDDLAGLGNAKRDYQVRCPIFVGGNLSVGSQKNNHEVDKLLNDGVSEIVSDPEHLLSMLQKLAKTPTIFA